MGKLRDKTEYLLLGHNTGTIRGMDLSSPLRSLIPTLDSAVLEVLAGTESSLSLAQVSKLAPHGSRAGLALALERLVDQGLVSALPANRGSMYRLNRQHVLADAVVGAAVARLTVLDRLAERVAQMSPVPDHVSVFGSFARREAGVNADIDVLFVLPNDADDTWFEQVGDLSNAIHAWTGNRMEYIVLSREGFTGVVQRGEPIVDSWLSDSVTVYGTAVERLVHDGTQVAEIAATEDGTAVNVAVGVAVLAGIAAGDAICISATGERYSGPDHSAAADLLGRVDREMGKKLRVLIGMKPGSHYGDSLLNADQRDRAIKAAQDLVKAAKDRV